LKKSHLCACVAVLGLTAGAFAQDAKPSQPGAKAPAAKAGEPGDPFTLATCPMMNKPIDPAKAKTLVYEGRELRFCCARCVRKFEGDPEKHIKTIDAKLVEQQKPFYPLETCLVSGEKLGSMGEPVDHIYRNRLVRFCCEHCIRDFEKDPAKHIAKLDEAVRAKQGASYALTTCPVSGEKLSESEKPYEMVVGNRLVKLCCKDCEPGFRKGPAKYLAMLDAGAKPEPAKEQAEEPKRQPANVNPGPRPQDHHPNPRN
jgi:YHS domain-containing protein